MTTTTNTTLYSLQEAARAADIGYVRLYSAVTDGRIKDILRAGPHWVFTEQDIARVKQYFAVAPRRVGQKYPPHLHSIARICREIGKRQGRLSFATCSFYWALERGYVPKPTTRYRGELYYTSEEAESIICTFTERVRYERWEDYFERIGKIKKKPAK